MALCMSVAERTGKRKQEMVRDDTVNILLRVLLNPPYLLLLVGRVHQCRPEPFFLWPYTSSTFTATLSEEATKQRKEVYKPFSHHRTAVKQEHAHIRSKLLCLLPRPSPPTITVRQIRRLDTTPSADLSQFLNKTFPFCNLLSLEGLIND